MTTGAAFLTALDHSGRIKWRVIASHPAYEVSSAGQIRVKATGEIKKPCNSCGYQSIGLSTAPRTNRVHRLVATAFIPNPNNHPVINHIDGNRQNNCVENLEWCTQKHNIHHAMKMGTFGARPWRPGQSGCRSLTDTQVHQVKQMIAAGHRPIHVARDLSIPYWTVQSIASGHTYVLPSSGRGATA